MIYNLFVLIVIIGVALWLLLRRRKRLREQKMHPSFTDPKRSRKRFAGLQLRMTFSYVWITVASLLLLFILFNASGFLGSRPDTEAEDIAVVARVAHQYAAEIAQQAQGGALGPVFPYPLGVKLQSSNPDYYADTEANSLLRNTESVPYLTRLYPDSQPVSFALLIAPDMRILSSSYALRYPPGEMATPLLPAQTSFFQQALHGNEQQSTFNQPTGTMIYATATVWSKRGQPAGAIYVQVPLTTLYSSWPWPNLLSYLTSSLSFTLVLLILLAPLGGIFGFISTRGLVKRLKTLAMATTLVADGHYQQRLRVASSDEVGQLELQFNRMAEQLGESTARQKELAEQNARLAERSRISRELHDAISQDLFSLSMLAGGLQSALPVDSPLQRQAGTLEQTTNTMIREMRALLLELRPTNLEALSLHEALAELAAAYSTRLNIVVSTRLAPVPLEARVEHTLLRIAQEALSNAARHANATEIWLKLVREGEGNILFSIQDNGRGFKTSEESLRHGLGLRLMQERVAEMHGQLSLASIPGQGTTLEVHLPLKESL
jgi:signal transduction histidine kinase